MNSLIKPLLEIRTRLIYCLIGFMICFGICYYNIEIIIHRLIIPFLQNANFTLVSSGVFETFLLKLHISSYCAILICCPWVLFQLWLGFSGGLYKNERTAVLILLICACILFCFGLSFGYYLITPIAIHFLQQQLLDNINNLTNVTNYIEFVFRMNINFAIVFQTPIIMIILCKLNIINAEQIAKFRKYAFILAFVVGAIIAPPDVLSQFILAIPLYILYEIGYICIKIINIKSHKT